jgi:hypothetical protein
MSDSVSVVDNEKLDSLSADEQKQLDADLKELSVELGEPQEPEQEPETPVSQSEEDDDDDDTPDVDPEREAIRQRRRRERQDKKKHRAEKEDSYKREIESLRRQLHEVNEWKNTVERRHVDTGVQQIDKAILDADSAIDLAKQAIKEATSTQDGDALVEAQELYYAARKRHEDLSRLKAGIAQRMSAPPQQNVDPVVVNNAKSWMDNKPWYDPTGRDMDSRVALQVDNAMAQEGWNPRDPAYWEELDTRLRKYLPHRFTNAGETASMTSTEQPRRKPPTSGSGQGRAPTSSNEYRLSPERVRAMKEAGMWDDPEKRKRMIKRYMEQDRNQG